jgi:hypothetical protein
MFLRRRVNSFFHSPWVVGAFTCTAELQSKSLRCNRPPQDARLSVTILLRSSVSISPSLGIYGGVGAFLVSRRYKFIR